MSLSDIIAIVDILVTIFVGFFLAHRLSVRDTRTRSVKDYYISELSSIRKVIEETFCNLLDGKMSANELVKWTGDMESILSEFDRGLRVVLPIYAEPIQEKVGNIIDELTNLEDINNQFGKDKISLSTGARVKVREYSHGIHEIFANYLYLINIAESYGWLHELTTKFNNIKAYYQAQNSKYIVWQTIGNLFYQCIREYMWVCVFVAAVFVLVSKFTRTPNSQEQDAPLINNHDIDTTAVYVKKSIPVDSMLMKMFPNQQSQNIERKNSQFIQSR